jgi:hypothetical protein
MQQNNSTLIFAGSKVIGKVVDGIFYKNINRAHYLRQPPAIAFDIDSLNQAEKAGASWVQVIDRDRGIVYRASLEHIMTKGFQFNRGWGEQIALPLSGWITSKHGGGLQLSLFGGKSPWT